MARIAWCLSVAIVVCIAGVADADALRKPTQPEALGHFKSGVAHYNGGEWQAAADAFKKSVVVESAPATHFNLAQSYRKLAERETDRAAKKEHLNQALFHYRRFLKTTANTPEFESRANTNIAAIDAELAEISRAEEEARAKATPSPVPQPTAVTPSSPQPSPPLDAETTPRHRQDWFAIGLIGVGAAGGLVGGGLYWSGTNLREEAGMTADQNRRNELRASADTRELSGVLVGGASAIVISVGILKLVLDSRDDASSTNVAWTLGGSRNGIVVVGWF